MIIRLLTQDYYDFLLLYIVVPLKILIVFLKQRQGMGIVIKTNEQNNQAG